MRRVLNNIVQKRGGNGSFVQSPFGNRFGGRQAMAEKRLAVFAFLVFVGIASVFISSADQTVFIFLNEILDVHLRLEYSMASTFSTPHLTGGTMNCWTKKIIDSWTDSNSQRLVRINSRALHGLAKDNYFLSVFHTAEIFLLLFILGFWSYYFWLILFGFSVHLMFDLYYLYAHNCFFNRAFSIVEYIVKSKGIKCYPVPAKEFWNV